MERMIRVNALIKRELGQVLERVLPRAPGCLVTVTEVRTTQDLRHAAVFVSIYGGGKDTSNTVMADLHRLRATIQRELVSHVRLKYTPVLDFHHDEHLAKADHLLQVLSALEQKEPPAPPG